MRALRVASARAGARRSPAFVVVAIAVAVLAGSCSSSSKSSSPTSTSPFGRSSTHRPNIVFVLTDDLSWNLVNKAFAPHIVALEHQGETFSHYFVDDSLCCPSRSSIFTGLFPHDTNVVTNVGPSGGFGKFESRGLQRRTFAVALRRVGYATSMLGKYLNGYGMPRMNRVTAPVPPGWSDWHVSNNSGYREYNFLRNDNGRLNFYTGPAKYGVDVLNSDAQSFIRGAAHHPFMVEVATFAPHAPYTPAIRNANDFPGLREPRDPSFNTNNVNPPAWLGNRPALTPPQVTRLNTSYRRRAQAVEAVDKLVGDTEATLAAEHLTNDTYFVFSSDNGYHMGQHRLARGKQTAFDIDINVPLIIAGPGVPAGRIVPQVTQNVDLYPTFVQLAGGRPKLSVEGHSLLPLLHPGRAPVPWRTVALVEHHGLNTDPADPDFEGGSSDPTTYDAIRISAQHVPGFQGPVDAVYVEYKDRARETEYYDIAHDPYERINITDSLTAAQRTELHKISVALRRCHSGAACWAAALPA